MPLKRNVALMALSTASRLGAGLFTFSILARVLGPESFGVLMLGLSVAVLLSLIPNYGLTPFILREIGANPKSAEAVMNEGFTAKLILTAALFVVAIIAVLSFRLDAGTVFFLLLVGAVADSFTEFMNAAFRARDSFATETRISTVTALLHATIVCSAVVLYPSVQTAAVAYAVSRLCVLAITRTALARAVSPLRLVSFRRAVSRLRSTITYAVDFGVNSLFGQIDSVVLNYFVGPIAVGLHQAGMRVFLGLAQLAPILANVFLPRAAGRSRNEALFAQECRRLQLTFLVFGTTSGLALSIFAKPLVFLLFGNGYLALVDLMPLFGLLLFTRFLAAAWGLVLTATGNQMFRMWASVFHWLVIAASAIWLVPLMGNRGWLLSLFAGTTVLAFIYAARGSQLVPTHWSVLALAASGGLAFLPFLHFA
ncbi:MAG: oligosaccharide flippase family protein [Betaproteobacteria bacterium]